MAVLRIDTSCRLPSCTDVKSVRNIDVHMLIWIFGNAGTDDREVFLLIAARSVRIDKRLHRQLAIEATIAGLSLNALIAQKLISSSNQKQQ